MNLQLLKLVWEKFQSMPSSHAVILAFLAYYLYEKAGVTLEQFVGSIFPVEVVVNRIGLAETNIIAAVQAALEARP